MRETEITSHRGREYFTMETDHPHLGSRVLYERGRDCLMTERESTSYPSWGGRGHFTREAEYPKREAEYHTKENVCLMTGAWSIS